MKRLGLLGLVLVFAGAPACPAADDKPLLKRHEEVIYGHKTGMALTLDYLQPQEPNGAGIIYIMSGGWISRRDPLVELETRAKLFSRLLERGLRCS